MPKTIFVNLPVADLPASMAFYAGLGFVNEPRFTDDTAAAMQWSDTIIVMLLTHAKWKTFTDRPIPPPTSSEVMLCLNFESREAVNATAEKAAGGGTLDIQPPSDHGFMMTRTVADPDGHIWEFMWMDPAFANADANVPLTAA